MSDPAFRIVKHRDRLSLAFTCPERGRVRVALGTDDRGVAEARAREIWSRRQRPASDRVGDLWAAYIADRALEVTDLTRLKNAWKALKPHFDQRVGSAVNQQDCRDYYQARKRMKRADSTIRTELEYLRAALNRHYGRGNVRFWTPPASAPRERFLTQAEADALLAAISTPHVQLFVTLALTTGARMAAILDLTWSRVDLDAKTPTVNYAPAGRHETNKRRVVVPLNRRAIAALTAARAAAQTDFVIEFAGEQITSIKKAVRSAATRSGVPCSPHVFRHTAGVWMAQADVPMQKIAQFLGHTRVSTTERIYARYSPSFMQDASAALDW